jgi:hypothetical protein
MTLSTASLVGCVGLEGCRGAKQLSRCATMLETEQVFVGKYGYRIASSHTEVTAGKHALVLHRGRPRSVDIAEDSASASGRDIHDLHG